MDDVGSFTAQQAHQLDQAEKIAYRTDWAADMFEREVAGFRRDRSLAEGAHSVRGDDTSNRSVSAGSSDATYV